MLTVTLNQPFREGESVILDPALASGRFDVAVEGHGYQLDLASQAFSIESLDFMRTQQDQGQQAGEQSLSTTSLWRRSLRSWHLGAGQSRGDEEGSSPYRFLSSKGVNPWEKWELTLLPDTTLADANANTPIGTVVAGTTAFLQAGATVRTSTDGDTWSACATLASAPRTLPVSDGEALYTACEDGEIRKVVANGTTTTAWTVPATDVLALAKGRMWAGATNKLYPLTPGSAVTAEFTHPWTGWRWTAICEGPRAVYAAGYLGDKSQVYRVPFKDDGTGFDAAVVAATLPDGELVTSMTSYLGFLLLGTSKGLRFGALSGDGEIAYGSLIETTSPVRCFEPQDRFVWFGWSDYDTASTGLGRMDLSTFTADLTPAYASDLMYDGQGDVTSIATLGGRLIFTVENEGLVAESTTRVLIGELVASALTWGLYDKKVASVVTITHEQLDGLVQIGLSTDGSSVSTIAESSTTGSTGPDRPLVLAPIKGVTFSLTLSLVRGDLDGPVLTGVMFAAKPIPIRGKRFRLPLLLSTQADLDNVYVDVNPQNEQAFLESLVEAGQAVSVQIAGRTYSAFPMNFRFIPDRKSPNTDGWTGTFVLELDEVTT